MNPLEQIICDTIEKRDNFPIPARDVYMVMGKFDREWKTIITKTDDINHARRTLYAANLHGKFKRVVLCKAREVQGINTLRWKTLECALPMKAQIITPSDNMRTLLNTMQQNPANRNTYSSFAHRNDKQTQAVPIKRKRELANFPLSVAIIGAILSVHIIAIVAALALVVTDWLYIEGKVDSHLDAEAFAFFTRYRHLIYFIIALSVLIPAMVSTFSGGYF